MYDKVIGIYMPSHNRVELLKKAVASVQAQSYQNFKLVIVNDGSTDGTQEYLEALTDPRISFITHEKAMGACRSRNDAIASLDTELVTGLDDDDIFLPERLTELLSIYNENYAFVCSGYYWDYGVHKKALFSENREISLSDAFDLNQCSNQILVNRQRVLAVDGFDETIPALQDHDLWVRLIAKFGAAYRLGKPSYIVNDDHSFERISSRKNKLDAIAMFEKKHSAIMSKRNKENFTFYKAKINGDGFSFMSFVKSTRYGLFGLKSRQYISQHFKIASKLRLQYLQTGDLSFEGVRHWFMQFVIPLLATGGPGASRVILLSACIFFFGATETSSFSGDFFLIMLLNTAFSQSYGFFLLKPKYEDSFYGVIKQSNIGLITSALITVGLGYLGGISELYYSLALLAVLHYYYIYRFKNIAQQYFVPLALAEIVISSLCLMMPYFVSLYTEITSDIPYQIYFVSCVIGLFIMIILSRKVENVKNNPIPFSRLRNISISTTASIFAIFILPTAIKTIAQPEVVSIVALTISCISISMLIPRAYANKIMRNLAQKRVINSEFQLLSKRYKKLIMISALCGLFSTMLYLYFINPEFTLTLLTVPIGICAILVSAQFGFISLTFLSLQGADQQVAKMNLTVLIVTALFTLPVIMGVLIEQVFIYVIVLAACISFVIRNKLASRKVLNYLN